jgi:hypothetical protein
VEQVTVRFWKGRPRHSAGIRSRDQEGAGDPRISIFAIIGLADISLQKTAKTARRASRVRKNPLRVEAVIPAVAKRRAGIQKRLKCLDSRFRGNDDEDLGMPFPCCRRIFPHPARVRTEPDLHLIKQVEQVTLFWRLGNARCFD